MQLGLVIGSATMTVKHPSLSGERLLVVQLTGVGGRPDGEPVLAFDRIGARRGDEVLVSSDGKFLGEQVGRNSPGRWFIMGLSER